MKTLIALIVVAVALSGCATGGYRLGDVTGSPALDGLIGGGALGAGLGAAGCAAAGVNPALCAKIGAVVGGGAGALYGINEQGRIIGRPVYVPSDTVILSPAPALYPRVIWPSNCAPQWGNVYDDPYNPGIARYVPTGLIECRWPNGQTALYYRNGTPVPVPPAR